jgi:D-3-phosphoglycerate dehydrogenase
MKVVVADCSWKSIDVERRYLPAHWQVAGFQCRTEAEVLDACGDADAVLAEYAPLSRPVVQGLGRCRIISNSAIGVDNIDLEAATEAGILVAHVPHYCVPEVADQTLALLLAVNRQIIQYHQSVREGRWDLHGPAPMTRLEGQTLGLVGFGRIAQAVADRARGFGLKVLAYDPQVPEAVMERHHALAVGLDKLLEASHFISSHLPATPETAGFFSRDLFARMAQRPVFINTSRGKVVREADLVEALKAGQVSFAALDVLEEEPPSFRSELFRLDNVLITPHVGFCSKTALEEVRRRSALNVAHFFRGELDAISALNRAELGL